MPNCSRYVIIAFCISVFILPLAANEKLEWWDVQRKGANGMDWFEPEEWLNAASEAGIEVVRISPASWPSDSRDPLLGNADNFTALDANDLENVKQLLKWAEIYNVKVVLTMFSLPGARWRQHNDMKFDYRLWHDEKFHQQALAFWKALASEVKDFKSLVGYNPLNEPHPAREFKIESNENGQFETWYKENKEKTANLNRFYQGMVKSIREVDPHTPIILDGWFHASPQGIEFLEPVEDNAVIYAFHFYQPWIYTTVRVNKDRFSYPDAMPSGRSDATTKWTKKNLEEQMQPVVDWSNKHNIPPNRVWASEFGCDRRVKGAQQYLTDVISVLNRRNWHWAFYSYRAVDWDGMDYELGTQKLGWNYWQAIEEGKHPESLKRRKDNPLWNVIKSELRN